MTHEIKGGGNHELSTDINVITAEINAYQRVAGEAIFEIGRRLKHVKENDLTHGEYIEWLSSIGMTQPHANRFVRVFERFGNHSPGIGLPSSVTILSLLTPFDDEELEKLREMPDGTIKKLTEMSRREIEEFKRREREAIAEKEKAVAAAHEAERRAEQAERSEEIVRRQLEEIEDAEPKVITKTEYIEVDNTPDDYEQLKKEKEELAKRLAEIPETKQAQENDRPYGVKLGVEMYEALSELSDWQKKYSWIITDVGEFSRLAEADPNFRREFNRLNEFWRQMNEAVNRHKGTEVFEADYTIIN